MCVPECVFHCLSVIDITLMIAQAMNAVLSQSQVISGTKGTLANVDWSVQVFVLPLVCILNNEVWGSNESSN